MKVLLLVSFLLLVCSSHTKLRTNSPTDEAQLDLQHSETDNQINLLGQSQNLDLNLVLNTAAIQTALTNGLAKVYDEVKARGDLADNIVFNTPSVISIQSLTRNGVITAYTFQVNQEDRRGNTLRSVFTVGPGAGSSLNYFSYYAQNVATTTTGPDSLRSLDVSQVDTTLLQGGSLLQQAYNRGIANVKQIAASKGDIPNITFNRDLIVSIQSQSIGNETAYLFNVQSSTTRLEVILYSSFTVTKRGSNLDFTDFAYNAQKNQFGSALPQAVTLLPEGSENTQDVAQAYQLGLAALERIAKDHNDLASTDTFSVSKVSSIHRQATGGRDYSLTFQTNVNSTAGVVFTATFVVTSTNGNKALASYAYNELQQGSYRVIPENLIPRDINDVNQGVLAAGVQDLIQVAANLGHVPSTYTASTTTVAQYFSQHNTNDDDTFVYVFNTTDASTRIVIAASISVVVRGTQRILSGYAYNILSANSKTVISSSLETLNYTLEQNNANVSEALRVGLEGLRNAAVQKGDLGEGATFVKTAVNETLQRSTIGFDYTYIFRVEVETGTGITFGAVLSVTWRAVNNTRYLAAYAYNLQNATLRTVYPEGLINVNVQQAVNDATIRRYVEFGISATIEVAVNRTDLPAGFTPVGDPTVTSVQKQIIGRDFAYLFQLSFSGVPNITVAVGFTIVIRSYAPDSPIFTTYAYTVQSTRLTQVLAQAPVEVASLRDALQSNQNVRDAVSSGLDQLFNIIVNRGDLRRTDAFNASTVTINRVLSQATGNDVAYIFNVSVTTTTDITVSASLSVTIRATANRPILSGYAYIVQGSTLTKVGPSALEDQATTEANSGTAQNLLDYGVSEVIRIAKSAGNLGNAFPGSPTVRVTRVQSSATGNDATYVFDFNVEDLATKVRFAAVISVTLRAVSSDRVLNYFAYSVLYSNVSSLIPTDFVSADLNVATQAPGRDLLDFGVAEVIHILQRADLITDEFDNQRRQVISVQTQSVDGDTSYAFQVLISNEQGLILGAAITVTRRTVPTTANILVNYAYNLQSTTGKAVGTEYSRFLTTAEVAADVVREFLDAGAEFIEAAAKANNHIRNDVTFSPATAISAQELRIGEESTGYQFQANLDNGNGVTVSATFTVLQIDSDSDKVVSNYAYNVQTVSRNSGSSR